MHEEPQECIRSKAKRRCQPGKPSYFSGRAFFFIEERSADFSQTWTAVVASRFQILKDRFESAQGFLQFLYLSPGSPNLSLFGNHYSQIDKENYGPEVGNEVEACEDNQADV